MNSANYCSYAKKKKKKKGWDALRFSYPNCTEAYQLKNNKNLMTIKNLINNAFLPFLIKIIDMPFLLLMLYNKNRILQMILHQS